jgi:hypothetical protein
MRKIAAGLLIPLRYTLGHEAVATTLSEVSQCAS